MSSSNFSYRRALAGTLFCLVGLALPIGVAGQGISIGLSPEAAAYRWAEGLGLEDDALFLGGAATLGFGQYVALRGSYRAARSLSVSFEDTDYRYLDGSAVEGNTLDADVAAADLVFRLGRGPLVPIVMSSGGVFSIRPDGRSTSRQMFLGLGGGLGVRIGRAVEGQVVLQDVRFRVNRGLLAGQVGEAAPTDPSGQELWRNLHLGASLGARIGGSRRSAGAEDADRGFGGLYEGSTDNLFVPLELFAGMMRFHEDLGIGDRGQVGVRGGVDFGSYFGVRGTYWRGTASEFDHTEGIQSWSGEAQFSVGSVTRSAPYLILGFGQIAFDDDFRNDENLSLADQTSVIVGAGLRLPLWERIRLNASIRDYVIASGPDDEVAQPTDLRHNPAVELGISYLVLGRNGSRPSVPVAPQPIAIETQPVATVSTIGAADTIVIARPTPTSIGSDSIIFIGPAGPTMGLFGPDSARGYQSDQFVSIPIPTEGELRIRYGPAGAEQVFPPTAAVAGAGPMEAVQPFDAAPVSEVMAPSALTPQELRALEDRIAARMETIMTRMAALPDGRDAEIQALRLQVRDLTALVTEMMRESRATGFRAPSLETTTPAAMPATPSRIVAPTAPAAEAADAAMDLPAPAPPAAAGQPATDLETAALIRRLSALEDALQEDAAARLAREREERQRELDAAASMESAASIRRELDAVAAGFPDLVSIVETGRGTEITFGGALFGVGASELTDRARSAIAAIAGILRQGEGTILVEGHTDATGSAASNLLLSQRRAGSVRDALLSSGVDGRRVTVIGSGSSRPRADDATAEGRTMNRRVEVVLPP